MKNFRINILIRIALLTLTLSGLIYLVFIAGLKAAALFMAILVFIQIISLIYFTEQTNRVLSRFFSGIKYDDFTSTLHQESKGKSFNELNDHLSRVVAQFREIRMEKEENYRYLEQVFHHLSIPTISVRDQDEINFINHAARILFQKPGLRKLTDLDQTLVDNIREMRSGEKRLIRLPRQREVLQLMCFMTSFKLQGVSYQLISFQNIRSELEKSEVDAWQKLIRVLTHEIMNSITPVTTLADSLRSLLFYPDNQSFRGSSITPNQTTDISQAIDIIRKRSRGLLSFVETYRNLTKVPEPAFEQVGLTGFLNDIQRLFKNRFESEGIHFTLRIEPENLTVWADPQLLEQVLINLIINAIHATEGLDKREILITAQLDLFDLRIISVSDNGCGISEQQLEEIFIPFYSTKKEGSGVGLSISRQIMQAQGGEIRVNSAVGEGSEFVLVLR